MKRLSLGMLSVAGLVWLGCSSATSTPGGGSGGATGNSGGAVGNSGGAVGNSGGAVGNSGGAAPGSGGAVVGSGGTLGGVGGTVAGTGGTVAGTGGAVGATCTGATTADGYMDNGTLCGFAWTGMNKDADNMDIAGQTVDPPCGDGACFTGATVCGTASIPPIDADTGAYSGVMIGWNVAQSSDGGTESSWVSTGTGLTVNYTATGATGEVRVILQSGSTDYCAVLPASGTALTWADFSKECWTGGAMTPVFSVGNPIKALLVQVNGTDAAQTLTNFCLDSVTVN